MKALILVLLAVSLGLSGCVSTGGQSPLPPQINCENLEKAVELADADVQTFCSESMMNSEDCRLARISAKLAKNNLNAFCP